MIEAPRVDEQAGRVIWPRRLHGRHAFFLLMGLAVAVQLVQGLVTRSALPSYERSYWLVTYQEGFTRRGLAGELIRVATGSIATTSEIEALQWLLSLSLIVAVGVVVIAALRRETLYLDLAAIALCCSPFVFDFVVSERRPDQLGFVVVVVYGLALYKFPRRSFAAAALAGVALAIVVGVEDSTFLQCVPWAVVLALLAASTQPWSAKVIGRVALLCVPATIVAAASVFSGRLDASHVDALLAAARRHGVLAGDTRGVFRFLADDLSTSIDRVVHLPLSIMVGSIAVCMFLIALQGSLMLGFAMPRLGTLRDGREHVLALGLALVFAVVALVALLGLGFDWVRWFASFGLMAGVTATLGLLLRNPAREKDRPRMPLIPVVVIATYLLWLAPLSENLSLGDGLRYLIMLPR
jgi:hypothetical protein